MAAENLSGRSNRQLLIQVYRKLTKIERLLGLKRDQELSKLSRKLDRGTSKLAKSVAANQPGAQPKKA